jgi:hypothetical protein
VPRDRAIIRSPSATSAPARFPGAHADQIRGFLGFERSLVDTAERHARPAGSTVESRRLLAAAVYVLVVLLGVLGLALAPNDQLEGPLQGFVAYSWRCIW